MRENLLDEERGRERENRKWKNEGGWNEFHIFYVWSFKMDSIERKKCQIQMPELCRSGMGEGARERQQWRERERERDRVKGKQRTQS